MTNHGQAAVLIDGIAETALANGMALREHRRNDVWIVGSHINVLTFFNPHTGEVSRTYGRVNGHAVQGNGYGFALAQIVNAAAHKVGAL